MLRVLEEREESVVFSNPLSSAGETVSVGLRSSGWWIDGDNLPIIDGGHERQDIEECLSITEDDREVSLALDRLVKRQRLKLQAL